MNAGSFPAHVVRRVYVAPSRYSLSVSLAYRKIRNAVLLWQFTTYVGNGQYSSLLRRYITLIAVLRLISILGQEMADIDASPRIWFSE